MNEKHPKLTPERIAELSALAKKIDREEADEIKAMGRAFFDARDAKRKASAQKPSGIKGR